MRHVRTSLRVGLMTLLAFGIAATAAGNWPVAGGGSQDDAGNDMVVAESGAVYVIGDFRSVAYFGAEELSAQGSDDLFVVKYLSSGEVDWAASAGGSSIDHGASITVDDAENVYVTGYFHGTIQFTSAGLGGGGAGTISLTADDAYSDVFVARLGADGAWDWAKRAGGGYADEAAAIGFHPGNDSAYPPVPASVFIAGRYTCDFGLYDQLTTLAEYPDDSEMKRDNGNCAASPSQFDLYVARIDTDGNWIWVVDRDNGSAGNETLTDLVIDPGPEGALYVGGEGLSATLSTRFYEDFESGDLASGGWDIAYGNYGVSTQTSNSGSYSMYLRGLEGAVLSNPIDTAGYGAVWLDVWIRKGANAFSDEPDPGEDLEIWYYGESGWYHLSTLAGGGTAGQILERRYALPSDALSSDLRFYFLYRHASWEDHDYWHIDDVTIEVASTRSFVARLDDTLSAEGPPSWTWIQDADSDGDVRVDDLAFHTSGDLLMAATSSGSCTLLPGGPNVVGSGAMATRFGVSASGISWGGGWHTKAPTGSAAGVTADDDGNVYFTGAFSVQALFGSTTLTPEGGADIFVAKLGDGGSWQWAQSAGGSGADWGRAIATPGTMITDSEGQHQVEDLYVTGSFSDEALFGADESLLSAGGTDVFVANMVTEEWFDLEGWIVGDEVDPPVGAYVADATAVPEFYIGGEQVDALAQQIFLWVHDGAPGTKGKLWALQPVQEIGIAWHVSSDPIDPDRIPAVGGIQWPQQSCRAPGGPMLDEGCYQVHVAGVPTELEPPAGGYSFLTVINPVVDSSAGSADENKIFNAPRSGFSVVIYQDENDVNGGIATEVVNTYPYQLAPLYQDDVEWTIGAEITEIDHEELGRAGFVLNELAFYDASIYDRTARTGQIIPVNRVSPFRAQDSAKNMVVTWYRVNDKNVFWPTLPIRYECRWPALPDKIVVASEKGSDVLGQAPMDPLVFTSKQLYNQGDKDEPGYNPNDEHAFFAPSNASTGFDALFALRADFGSGLGDADPAAASDPYALLKYRDPDTQMWLFKIYKVLATGAGFDNFRYTGNAATTVSPPYPVRLLPNCAGTTVLGEQDGDPQPPPPFFRDYSDQLWAKSEGDGAIQFHYPLQPTWFFDLDNDDVMDVAEGQCVPWLARLPEAEGGSASPDEPIYVFYSISWPADLPLLQVGETLLKPKRGLPNIYNQEAVRVVFDELYETNIRNQIYDPEGRLVRLISPLSTRSLFFDPADQPPLAEADPTVCYGLGDLPDDLATEMNVLGQKVILGSVDGTIKLPYVLRSRLAYDPLNHKLRFKGSFDDSGAGEPLLLLNVMTQRERDLLKSISGSSSWDACMDRMYHFSRNPDLLVLSHPDTCHVECETIEILWFEFEICEEICVPPHGFPDEELFIGMQDSNLDGIPEPIEGVGQGKALTAGFAKDTGFVTLAFNDDPSLAPLPVSLNVIRVGCLRYPEDQDPPDLLSTYMGEIKVIQSDNVFDELLTLRHSGDFAGQADSVEFEWYLHPDEDGTPPTPMPDPEGGQMHGWLKYQVDDPWGANEITIGGANILALSDNWFVVRYRGLHACNNQSEWSVWAGQPGSTPLEPRAQLAEGWVKRVVRGLNPFEARVQQFHKAPTNTFASMLMQLGPRYEGDIALSPDPQNLNEIGLIEAYETVLRRAMKLSIDSTPPVDYGPANAAILNVASRITDFYIFFGNEAYADALDPMIGIRGDDPVYRVGSLAPTIFCFENQAASLLEEELTLLRGRDDSQGPVAARPVYNRYFWNFTSGNGEIAYAVSYNISDVYIDGVLDEKDAKLLFPQGHGDSWGHYLTAIKKYYMLLQHPFFTWDPRPEAVLVAGVPLQVDYFDERKFAKAAAAKAQVGADLVDLTYRQSYVEDPAGQWQGYKDTDPERAWGLAEWGKRAGMGAYLDWLTGNAILPAEDPNPDHVGIQRIDRKHNEELDEIVTAYDEIQAKVDSADRGLNPLGLAKGVVPFDIDPSAVASGQTHFEQIFDRAVDALDNVVAVWDHANRLNMMLRQNQDTIEKMTVNSRSRETSFKKQLIGIFGYPYDGDDLYPDGYDGPDLYHYMYTDSPVLEGTPFDIDFDPEWSDQVGPVQPVETIHAVYDPMPAGLGFWDIDGDSIWYCQASPLGPFNALLPGCNLGDPGDQTLDVEYRVWRSLDAGISYPKPETWGMRRATGKLQDALYQILQSEIALKKALRKYNNLNQDIADQVNTMRVTFNIRRDQFTIKNIHRAQNFTLANLINIAKGVKIASNRIADGLRRSFSASASCVPDTVIVGVASGGDVFAGVSCTLKSAEKMAPFIWTIVGDVADVAANTMAVAKEDLAMQASINVALQGYNLEMFNLKGKLDHMVREEPMVRADVYSKTEALQQAMRKYYQALAEGQRTLASLIAFRRNSAADIQTYRYEDMAYRIFRNDALDKYRASFDLAARYTYLAATAYDYETNLLGSDSQAGQGFLTDIVRERSIGQILNHKPVPGSRGLADPMGRMEQNFEVLKGQMGFNNPQTETNRFSLRGELFRISEEEGSDEAWRETLRQHRVDDLWMVPEFRRYCRPFAPETSGPQPGIVIPFSTTVTFGLNFFGWPLGPQDSAYDPTHFATKVRGVGVWFGDYEGLPLSNTPRVYIVPVGADILRSPSADDFKVREWTVVDQVLPVPFTIGEADVEDPGWIPLEDMLSGPFGEIRRFSSFRAHHYQEPFSDSEIISDSRLIGRSVWNTRWLLIMPGGTLLYDPDRGLDTFIEGQEVPGEPDVFDGQGVSDIKIFYQTYAYSGN